MSSIAGVSNELLAVAQEWVQRGWTTVPALVPGLILEQIQELFLTEIVGRPERHEFWKSNQLTNGEHDDLLVVRDGEMDLQQKDRFHDKKFFFHVKKSGLDELKLKFSSMTPQEQMFTQLCEYVYNITRTNLQPFVTALDELTEKRFDIVRDLKHPTSVENSVLRLLAYAPQPEGRSLAQDHKDRAWTTVALAESHPGLHFEGVPYVHDPFKSVLFFGRKAEGSSQGEFKAVMHGVASGSEVANKMRTAVVYFFHNQHVLS